MTNGHEFDQSAKYNIRVRGVLSSSWSEWFDSFTIRIDCQETILEGSVPDQSALHGLLAKINDLGLSLISVNQLTPIIERGDDLTPKFKPTDCRSNNKHLDIFRRKK